MLALLTLAVAPPQQQQSPVFERFVLSHGDVALLCVGAASDAGNLCQPVDLHDYPLFRCVPRGDASWRCWQLPIVPLLPSPDVAPEIDLGGPAI